MTPCSADDCDRPAKAHGLCSKHYQRWQSYGDPSVVLKPWGRLQKKQCSVDACEALAVCKGYCNKHYKRWRKHGSPMVTHAPELPDVPAYVHVHKRLRRRYGPASAYRCVACGDEARHWSCFRNRTATSDAGGVTVTYSLHDEDYAPLCVRCNLWTSKQSRGMERGSVRLTDDDVIALRRRAADGEALNYSAEARRLRVNKETVRNAVRGATWQHLL
jgi:hypothetical protein